MLRQTLLRLTRVGQCLPPFAPAAETRAGLLGLLLSDIDVENGRNVCPLRHRLHCSMTCRSELASTNPDGNRPVFPRRCRFVPRLALPSRCASPGVAFGRIGHVTSPHCVTAPHWHEVRDNRFLYEADKMVPHYTKNTP